VKLAGAVTASSDKKHGKSRHFPIAAVKGTVTAGDASTLTVKLPKPAVSALEAGDRESVRFVLTATDGNGAGKATAKVARVKLVKTSG
jgi:hypothetical protein